MNDSSISVSSSVNPRSTSRWLTNRRLFVALVLVLSAALLLLDRPTVLHWVCVAIALRMFVVLVLAMFLQTLSRPVQRAVWGSVAGILAIDLAFSAFLLFSGPQDAHLLVANPFVIIGAIVGAVAAMSNAALGVLAGVICYAISVGLLYGLLVWQSMQPRDPTAMCCFPVELAMFGILTVGVPIATTLSLIGVGSVKLCFYLRRRKHPTAASAVANERAPKQNRLRTLGLLGLLLLLLGTSVYLGWWIRPAFLSTRTRIAVDRLRQVEGHLDGPGPEKIFAPYKSGADYVSNARLREICYVALYGEALRDDDVVLLRELSSVERVAIGGPHVSDMGIAHLKHVPSLAFLQISNTRLTGIGLKELQGLNNLETLELIKCQIDDAGLANIGALKNLKSLSLEGTPISDAGLSGLKSLTHCTKINLIGTNVGDGAVQFFKDMPNLRIMLVHQSTTSKVTWDEVNRIMRQRNKSP